ncbi:MAG: hypothetical protein WC254_05290 [Candidatus Woesearchaeota archaeon]|jgi:hypothetical protein
MIPKNRRFDSKLTRILQGMPILHWNSRMDRITIETGSHCVLLDAYGREIRRENSDLTQLDRDSLRTTLLSYVMKDDVLFALYYHNTDLPQTPDGKVDLTQTIAETLSGAKPVHLSAVPRSELSPEALDAHRLEGNYSLLAGINNGYRRVSVFDPVDGTLSLNTINPENQLVPVNTESLSHWISGISKRGYTFHGIFDVYHPYVIQGNSWLLHFRPDPKSDSNLNSNPSLKEPSMLFEFHSEGQTSTHYIPDAQRISCVGPRKIITGTKDIDAQWHLSMYTLPYKQLREKA